MQSLDSEGRGALHNVATGIAIELDYNLSMGSVSFSREQYP